MGQNLGTGLAQAGTLNRCNDGAPSATTGPGTTPNGPAPTARASVAASAPPQFHLLIAYFKSPLYLYHGLSLFLTSSEYSCFSMWAPGQASSAVSGGGFSVPSTEPRTQWAF